MLQKLTAQLMQTNKLHIPHIGLFRIEHHSAVLHFADRSLDAPYYKISFEPLDSNHNVSNEFVEEDNAFRQRITDFGENLKKSIIDAPFLWSGVGTLEIQNEQVVFQPVNTLLLSPVPANKVLRENRQHAILVGDQEQSSADISFIGEGMEKKKTWLWIGWIILLIAMLVIGFIIYKEGSSFGSKIKAGTALHRTIQQSYYS